MISFLFFNPSLPIVKSKAGRSSGPARSLAFASPLDSSRSTSFTSSDAIAKKSNGLATAEDAADDAAETADSTDKCLECRPESGASCKDDVGILDEADETGVVALDRGVCFGTNPAL